MDVFGFDLESSAELFRRTFLGTGSPVGERPLAEASVSFSKEAGGGGEIPRIRSGAGEGLRRLFEECCRRGAFKVCES